MRVRVSLVVPLSLALVVALAGASAAITEKQAVKQATDAAKSRLAVFKLALGGSRAVVLAHIDVWDAQVKAGTFSVLGVQSLVDDLAAFQSAVEDALFDLAVNTASDGHAALVALAGGGALAQQPLALANGVGGLPDVVRAAAGKSLAATYRSVNKRLAKSTALAGKLVPAALFAVLDPPPQLHFAFTDLRGDAILFNFAIDLRVSASTAALGDGRLWVGGTTSVGGQNVTVSAVAMDTTPTTEDVPVVSEGRGRFLARFGDSASLPRSNYLVGAIHTAGGGSVTSSFTLR